MNILEMHDIHKSFNDLDVLKGIDLSVAKGDYIAFVDSDDYVSPDYFKAIDRICDETPADLTQFSYRNDNGKQIYGAPYSPMYVKTRKMLIYSACNKFYDKKLIDKYHIRFLEDLEFGEDRIFNYSFLLKALRT